MFTKPASDRASRPEARTIEIPSSAVASHRMHVEHREEVPANSRASTDTLAPVRVVYAQRLPTTLWQRGHRHNAWQIRSLLEQPRVLTRPARVWLWSNSHLLLS